MLNSSKLLVGSVFSDDSPIQQKWLSLQLQYLKATTPQFEHIAVVMSGTTNSYFSDHTKVVVPEDTSLHASAAHLHGLKMLNHIFLEQPHENFLFIDGDAFPIKKNWMNVLLASMEPQDYLDNFSVPTTSNEPTYEIAIALRSENLETRLHASILFAKKQALQYLKFADQYMGLDLEGHPEDDIHLELYQKDRRTLAKPLIRTNQQNVHPVACGIYFDMFYHHCCGSGRHFNVRSNSYYNRIIKQTDNLNHLTERLMKSPNDFIHGLAGWNPTRYGVIEGIQNG